MKPDKIIGIDLGTTNSCVAVIEGGETVVIPNSEGTRTTPSIVLFDQSGQRHVGIVAKKQAVKHPGRTIQSIKRYMGTNHRVSIDHMSFSPEQISACILQKLKVQAQNYLGEKVTKAIITVPAYFDDSQRLATRHAGQIAGLEVVRVINEPTASALAYGLNKLQQEANIIIFDFGGGTFDVTILQLSEQVLQVKATNGNNHLGGDDFDQRIINWLIKKFKEDTNIDLASDHTALQRLKEAAEKAKIDLSGLSSADIQLPFIAYQSGDPFHLDKQLSRQEFNNLIVDLVQATEDPIKTALQDAKLAADQINYVVLVGGTTRIPAVQEFIRQFFQKEPVKSVNPDEAVAIGAAIQGAILTGEIQSVLLLDVIPLTLGIEEPDGRFAKLIGKNTTIPTSRKRIFTTTSNQQTTISVHVLQGESEQAKGNISLAHFELKDIPAAAAGVAQIEVAFDIDADGIFYCTAQNIAGGAPQFIELKRTTGFNHAELEQLTKEHAIAAEKEQKLEEQQAITVKAESCIVEAERALNKHSSRLSANHINQIQTLIDHLKQAIAVADIMSLESLGSKLDAVIQVCARLDRPA